MVQLWQAKSAPEACQPKFCSLFFLSPETFSQARETAVLKNINSVVSDGDAGTLPVHQVEKVGLSLAHLLFSISFKRPDLDKSTETIKTKLAISLSQPMYFIFRNAEGKRRLVSTDMLIIKILIMKRNNIEPGHLSPIFPTAV